MAHRLKLSPIVGYLLAGVLVGPFTPGFVADRAVAEQFAEIGVILLLFGIGLRFHLREFLAVWRVAIPAALIQAALSAVVLALLMRLFGWSWTSAIILDMGITSLSTVVMAKVLAERHDLHARIGHIALGWTVVEDLIAVSLLLLLPILFGPNAGERSAEPETSRGRPGTPHRERPWRVLDSFADCTAGVFHLPAPGRQEIAHAFTGQVDMRSVCLSSGHCPLSSPHQTEVNNGRRPVPLTQRFQ